MRRAGAVLLLVVAAGLAAAAHDMLAWRDVLRGDDVRAARTWLPGDPVRSVLAVDDELAQRRAVRSFRVGIHDRARLRQRRHPDDATLDRRGATGRRCSTRIVRRCIAGGKPARRARRRRWPRHRRSRRRRPGTLDLRGGDPARSRERGRQVQPRAAAAAHACDGDAAGAGQRLRGAGARTTWCGLRDAGAGVLTCLPH